MREKMSPENIRYTLEIYQIILEILRKNQVHIRVYSKKISSTLSTIEDSFSAYTIVFSVSHTPLAIFHAVGIHGNVGKRIRGE